MTTKIEKTQKTKPVEPINAAQAFDLSVLKYKDKTNGMIETIYENIRDASENGLFNVEVEIIYGEPYTKLVVEHFKNLNYRVKRDENALTIEWNHLDVSASPV